MIHRPDDFDLAQFVDMMLAEFPGMEADAAFLEEMAENVAAGRDPDTPPGDRSRVAAELRRRALKLRN